MGPKLGQEPPGPSHGNLDHWLLPVIQWKLRLYPGKINEGHCSLVKFFLTSFKKRCVWGFFINLFIYLFLAALGLCCCAWAFSSCGEQGLLFFAGRGLLIAVASLVAEHGL